MAATDLKNRTGTSIYSWETEANGGHIGVKENKNSDIFYLKLNTNWILIK